MDDGLLHNRRVDLLKNGLYYLTLLFLGLAVIGCQESKPAESVTNPTYRAHYDTLRLQSPEEAIRTFVRAYQRNDFHTVYMILAPATQQTLAQNALQWGGENIILDALTPEAKRAFQAALGEQLNLKQIEHNPDSRFLFVNLWGLAAAMELLPFQFPGEVTYLDSRSSATPAGQEALDVIIKVEGLEDQPVFRLVRSPIEKWRIYQILWPGGSEDDLPFSIRSREAQTVTISPVRGAVSLQPPGYDELDLSTPSAAVNAFSQAFQQKNFPLVFSLLHADAQRAWWFDYSLGRHERLVALSAPGSVHFNTEYGQKLLKLKEAGAINSDDIVLVFAEFGGSSQSPVTPLVMEQIGDASYLFDQVMMSANVRYLFDLTLPVKILEAGEETRQDGALTIDVIARLGNDSEEVIFRLKRSTSGQWRVRQVIGPNGDRDILPWAVAAAGN